MPTDILIYALVAAGLVFWLRNILGTRHGDENERPNPFSSSEGERPAAPAAADEEPTALKIAETTAEFEMPLGARIDNKTAENGLEEIGKADKDFDTGAFLSAAQSAFRIVVEAFAAGDKDTLKTLLAPPVYSAFEGAIDQRESKGESVETKIHDVRKTHIIDTKLKGNMAFITVRFSADETCVIRDKEGDIISGDPDRKTKMVDVWVFGRDVTSKDPVWHVYETRDDEIEDHKTPVPDAS